MEFSNTNESYLFEQPLKFRVIKWRVFLIISPHESYDGRIR